MASGPVLPADSNTATVRIADVLHAECRPCSNTSMPSDMRTTSWRKLMLSCNPCADLLQKLFKASGRVYQILCISRINSGGTPQIIPYYKYRYCKRQPYLPQTSGQVSELLLQLCVKDQMEDILNSIDMVPGSHAAADHLSQIMWCHQIPLQQVQAHSSTEPLQASTSCDLCWGLTMCPGYCGVLRLGFRPKSLPSC